ncbi:MAG: Flp family type IVb pilin [Dehalococcoidia bacterium]
MTIAQLAHAIIGKLRNEAGQDLAEYALILAIVFVGCIVALGILAGGITEPLESFGNFLSGAGS